MAVNQIGRKMSGHNETELHNHYRKFVKENFNILTPTEIADQLGIQPSKVIIIAKELGFQTSFKMISKSNNKTFNVHEKSWIV